MELELKDKRVLVTGASQGIGLAIAKGFLAEGARVVIAARGKEKLHEALSSLTALYGNEKVKSVSCDCTNSASLNQLKASIVSEFGGLDAVVALSLIHI